MQAADIRKILKSEPFRPIRIGLSDGRCVLVRHPEQVVVSDRYIYVALAKLETSLPLATPKTGDAIAKDFIWVNLLHIATVEPDEKNGTNGRRKAKRRRKS